MHVSDWYATYSLMAGVDPADRVGEASGSHLDLGPAPYVPYGVKYIDPVSPNLLTGGRRPTGGRPVLHKLT